MSFKTPRKVLTLAEMGYGHSGQSGHGGHSGVTRSSGKEEERRNFPRAKRMADLLEQMSCSKPKSVSSRKPLRNLNQVQNHYLSTSKKNTNRRQTTAATGIRRAITFNTFDSKTTKFDLNTLSDIVTVKSNSTIITRSSKTFSKPDLESSVNSSFSTKKIVSTKGKENENYLGSKKLSIITETSSRENSTGKIDTNSAKCSTSYASYRNNVNDTIDSLPDSSLPLTEDKNYSDNKIDLSDLSMNGSLCTLFTKVNLEKDPTNIGKHIDEISHKIEDSIANIQQQMSLLTTHLESQKSILQILKTLKDASVDRSIGERLRTNRKSLRKSQSKSDSNLRKSVLNEKTDDKKNKSVVFKTPHLGEEPTTPPSIGLRVKLLKMNAEKANNTLSTSKNITPKKTHEFYSTLKKSMKFLKTPVDKKDNVTSKLQTPGTKLSKNVHRQLSVLYDQ